MTFGPPEPGTPRCDVRDCPGFGTVHGPVVAMPHTGPERETLARVAAEYLIARVDWLGTNCQSGPDAPAFAPPDGIAEGDAVCAIADALDDVAQTIHDATPRKGQRRHTSNEIKRHAEAHPARWPHGSEPHRISEGDAS